MDTWLGPGELVAGRDRRELLQRLTLSMVLPTRRSGAPLGRTAIVEQGDEHHLTLRMAGRGLARTLARDPRITLSATTHLGGNRLTVIDGTATVLATLPADHGRDVLLLSVAVERVECWGDAASPARPRAATSLSHRLAHAG